MPTVSVTVAQLDDTASQGQARDHQLVMDRPEAKGGRNQGPVGGETLLMGLGGSFMSNLLAAAKARGIALNEAKVIIAGELADAPARYIAIHMTVSGQCDGPDELQKLVTIADRGCIVCAMPST